MHLRYCTSRECAVLSLMYRLSGRLIGTSGAWIRDLTRKTTSIGMVESNHTADSCAGSSTLQEPTFSIPNMKCSGSWLMCHPTTGQMSSRMPPERPPARGWQSSSSEFEHCLSLAPAYLSSRSHVCSVLSIALVVAHAMHALKSQTNIFTSKHIFYLV